jgi:hypothetical protein
LRGREDWLRGREEDWQRMKVNHRKGKVEMRGMIEALSNEDRGDRTLF